MQAPPSSIEAISPSSKTSRDPAHQTPAATPPANSSQSAHTTPPALQAASPKQAESATHRRPPAPSPHHPDQRAPVNGYPPPTEASYPASPQTPWEQQVAPRHCRISLLLRTHTRTPGAYSQPATFFASPAARSHRYIYDRWQFQPL